MALEDLAMMPRAAQSQRALPVRRGQRRADRGPGGGHPGPAYIRTSRQNAGDHANDEQFVIGGLKVLRQSAQDVATVVGAGVTVFEALKAYEQLKASGIAIRVIDLYSVARGGPGRPGGRRPGDAGIPDYRRRSLCRWRHWRCGGRGGRPEGLSPPIGRSREPTKRQAGRAAGPFRNLGASYRRGGAGSY
jgi:hypothetical protein